MAIAGSPGKSCCRPKIRTETRKSVGTSAASRRARKRDTARARSLHAQAREPHHAVGDRLQSRELRVVREEQVAVVQVEDRAQLRFERRGLLEILSALPGIDGDAL